MPIKRIHVLFIGYKRRVSFFLSFAFELCLLQSPHTLDAFEEVSLYQSAAGKIENEGQPQGMVAKKRP